MVRHAFDILLVVVFAGCTADGSPCARAPTDETRPGLVIRDAGYEVVMRDDGAIVVVGTGSLPWRTLYATPRNCAGPGDGAGNPILLTLFREGTIEFVDADGCGEEVVVVSSDLDVEVLARRVGAFLESHRLRERVAIVVGCDTPR